MAKVDFRRVNTNAEAENLDIKDGQFIVTGEGKTFVDFGNERKSIAGTPDTEMSDTCTNSVENKVIKGYVDDSLNDYVKLVKVSYGQSVTINAHSSTEINVSAPTITGYKLLGCVGGNGVGLTGLLVSSSYNDIGSSNYFNRWVFNARDNYGTWTDVEFMLLYVKDI